MRSRPVRLCGSVGDVGIARDDREETWKYRDPDNRPNNRPARYSQTDRIERGRRFEEDMLLTASEGARGNERGNARFRREAAA